MGTQISGTSLCPPVQALRPEPVETASADIGAPPSSDLMIRAPPLESPSENGSMASRRSGESPCWLFAGGTVSIVRAHLYRLSIVPCTGATDPAKYRAPVIVVNVTSMVSRAHQG